jgi:hypothetical protein
MRKYSFYLGFLLICTAFGCTTAHRGIKKQNSGNPVFEGWYADPEIRYFDKQYWIFPTYSAAYNKQVF